MLAALIVAPLGHIAALASTSAPAPSAAVSPPQQARTDWARTTSQTPEGAFVQGNPDAPVRLVEYLSYSCTHCGEFSSRGYPLLRAYYIDKGLVAYEVRNVLHDRLDVTAALMARCGGTERFFALTEALFDAQYSLLINAYDYARAHKLAPPGARAAQTRDFVTKVGLEAFMTRRGFTAAQVDACLFAPEPTAQIAAMSREAHRRFRVFATPYFLINGVPVRALNWEMLRPQIDAALAQGR